jgi:hypothetical protein
MLSREDNSSVYLPIISAGFGFYLLLGLYHKEKQNN